MIRCCPVCGRSVFRVAGVWYETVRHRSGFWMDVVHDCKIKNLN